jgi:hypothetical protein
MTALHLRTRHDRLLAEGGGGCSEYAHVLTLLPVTSFVFWVWVWVGFGCVVLCVWGAPGFVSPAQAAAAA